MSERTDIAVEAVHTALSRIHAQVKGLTIDNDALAADNDKLVERSVGAMAIAEGTEGYEKIPIDCPMLQAVSDLRKMNAGDRNNFTVEREKLQAEIDAARKAWTDLQTKAGRLEAAANEVLRVYMPQFSDSRAVDDCLVGLAAAVGGAIVTPDPQAGLANAGPAMHETNYFRHFLLAKLSKCAFCGSSELAIQQVATEERGDGFVVDCLKCGASGPQTRGMVSACAAWNERAQ